MLNFIALFIGLQVSANPPKYILDKSLVIPLQLSQSQKEKMLNAINRKDKETIRLVITKSHLVAGKALMVIFIDDVKVGIVGFLTNQQPSDVSLSLNDALAKAGRIPRNLKVELRDVKKQTQITFGEIRIEIIEHKDKDWKSDRKAN